jgi:hypothetical protein
VTSSLALTALLLGAAMALPGCSATEPAPSGATAGTEAATATPSEPAGCGDVADVVKEHLGSPDVASVGVNGQCTNVDILTTLADDDTAGGRRLCESAGEVAYTGDINSVTVKSTAGAELSVGIPGMKCLP